MDLQGACNLLLDLEQKVAVNSILHEEVSIWPVVRQVIWGNVIQTNQVFGRSNGVPDTIGSSSRLSHFKTVRHLQYLMRGPRIYLRRKNAEFKLKKDTSHEETKSDICLLSQPIYYSETLEGRPYNRIIDPIYEYFSKDFNCLKLESIDNYEVIPERHYPCHFFAPLPHSRKGGRAVSRSIDKARPVLADISSLSKIPEQRLVDITAQCLQTVVRYRDTYQLLFEHFKPKVVLVPCYYVPTNMGLLWAASRMGIPTVDVQHGKQGKFQGMYSHWTSIPEKGYSLLPKWFWTWGQESAENIMRWQRERRNHRCLIGGFPWLARWKKLGWDSDSFKRPHGKKIITVTLQAPVGGLKDIFPDFIAEAIKSSPENCLWLLREHPNYRQGRDYILNKLQGVDPSKYRIGKDIDFPLYSILANCDFHLTAYSTVCYEAESFSVPTAIFSEIGKKLYEKEISCGRFVFVDNAQGLNRAIVEFTIEKIGEKYIESDFDLMRSLVNTVIGGTL